MLVTQQPIFKRFWYPVMPVSHLAEGPRPFQLLGQPIVLWLDSNGQPAALEDRCCHRTAQLSRGKVENGCIVCPYHGWTYEREGTCVHVPQLGNSPIPASYRVKSVHCTQQYGYAWVCLGEPLYPIPAIPEAGDGAFRQIHEFYEPWHCAGLRVMENELDLAHPTFVHTTTFGSQDHPIPDEMEMVETDFGLRLQAALGVSNNSLQQKNLKMESLKTTRLLEMDWFMPFTCKLRIGYPNGLVHIIVNTATPISDRTSQIVQFCLRNDTEADVSATDVIAFDRQVTLEDKAILETTDYDVPLVISREEHMMTDKPGLLMRRRILALLKEHGEVEQTRERPSVPSIWQQTPITV